MDLNSSSFMRGSRFRVILALLGIVLLSGSASAFVETDVEPTRYFQANCSGSNFDFHWNQIAIPVYLSTNLGYGVQYMKQSATVYWTVSDLAEQLKMSLANFNSDVGVSIRLYYAGTTTSTSIDGAIVVVTNRTPTNAIGTTSPVATCNLGTRGEIVSAVIRAELFLSDGSDRYFLPYDFQSGIDVWDLFTHELGHALGLQHSDSATLLDSCGTQYVPSPYDLMNSGGSPNERHWTKYEKDTLRLIYGTRSGTVRFWQSGPNRGYGVTSWTTFYTLGGPANTNIASGIGKMSEGANMTLFAWADSTDLTIHGYLRTYNHVFWAGYQGSTSYPVLMPPSMAYGNGEYRAYWLERDPDKVRLSGCTAPYGTGADGKAFSQKRIGWMSSTDGTNWTQHGYLTDPSSGAEITTYTDNVSAGYDPYSGAFAVLWIDDDYNGRMYSMPGPGSSQPIAYQAIHQAFWEAPSIACSGASDGCLIVGVEHNAIADLYTERGGFQTTGYFQSASTQEDTVLLAQGPTIAYQPWASQFVLSWAGRDDASVWTAHRQPTASWVIPSSSIASFSNALAPVTDGNAVACTTCPHHAVIVTVLYGP